MKVISEKFGSMDNNCSLIIDEKTNQSALVDCNEFSQKMIDMIGDTDLKYILLTHGHFDHIIGARDTKAKYGAKVVISSEDKPMLSSSKLSLAAFCNATQNDVEADVEEGSEENKVCTETVDEIKKDLKSYLKSMYRLGK